MCYDGFSVYAISLYLDTSPWISVKSERIWALAYESTYYVLDGESVLDVLQEHTACGHAS
eukprot:6212763-Pleurochrysis_carterae.AAC.1